MAPVVGSMENKELGAEREKLKSAFVPRSTSEALAVKITEPTAVSSLRLTLYASWLNTGALSLTSVTTILTVVFDESGGVPPSVTSTASVYVS